ncbi:MAG: RNA polymerase sigma factor SigZ [Sneathiella sp.]
MDKSQVWLDYRANLKSFLHSRVSNPADVEDLLQEIFIKAFDNLHTVRSSSNVKAWLFQITNNAIMDHYRHQKKPRTVHPEDLWYVQDDPDLQQEMSACIAPFIDALPKKSAQLLRQVDLKGVSQKEMAETTGVDYSTLKSQVQKSRRELRDLFENCCSFSFGKNGEIINYALKSDGCRDC